VRIRGVSSVPRGPEWAPGSAHGCARVRRPPTSRVASDRLPAGSPPAECVSTIRGRARPAPHPHTPPSRSGKPMADNHFDIIVIGGGPGGYVGAIRAAQLGYKTASSTAPSSAASASTGAASPPRPCSATPSSMEKLAHKQDWGLEIKGEVEFDWDKVIGRSRGVADKLNKGVEFLMKKNKIDHFVGHAKITKGATGGTPCEVELYDCEVQEELTSAPRRPPTSPAEAHRRQGHHRHRLGRPRPALRPLRRRQDLGRPRGDVQQGAAQEHARRRLRRDRHGVRLLLQRLRHRGHRRRDDGPHPPVEDEDVSKQMLRHYKKGHSTSSSGRRSPRSTPRARASRPRSPR
jgi:hypothetical protein